MKLNKKTQDLLNEFECAIANVKYEDHIGTSHEDAVFAQANYDNAEKELNRHLFKLEQRLRLCKKSYRENNKVN